MSRLVVLDFYKEGFRFSAGHFTIFSATEREPLHGHSYSVAASLKTTIDEPGISFDYRIFKEKLRELCDGLHLRFLLPKLSPHLKISEKQGNYEVKFHQEKLCFPKQDVLLLPIENTTLEDLSHYFLNQLIEDRSFIKSYHIKEIIIKVFNNPEQSAAAEWKSI